MTTSPQGTDQPPLTEELLAKIRERFQAVINDPKHKLNLRATDMLDVLNEVDRLRAELAETRRVADLNNAAFVKALDESAAELADGNASDGYHTHNELYDYRMLYNAHAVHGWLAAGHPVVKSWKHSDGELCFGGGWFVVAAVLPTGQVTNHYEAKHWGLFNVPEAVPPEYDGHTPADAADRLRVALDQSGEGQANG
jgi:hypothetical protein